MKLDAFNIICAFIFFDNIPVSRFDHGVGDVIHGDVLCLDNVHIRIS